jgi:hypothetical protein
LRQHADQHDRGRQQRNLAKHWRRHIGRDLVDGAKQCRGRGCARHDRRAAANHRNEGLGDVCRADRREHPGHRRNDGAGKTGERCAGAERDGIDAARIDAERRGHIRVLHRPPRDQPESGEAQNCKNSAEHHNRDANDENRIGARPILADFETAKGRRQAHCCVAEDRGGQADEKQAQAPGREHRIDHTAIEPSDNGSFDNDADRADDDRRDDQHRDPDAEAQAVRLDRRVAAKHQKLAVGEIDDLHHSEDHRQPHAHESEAGDRIEDLNGEER